MGMDTNGKISKEGGRAALPAEFKVSKFQRRTNQPPLGFHHVIALNILVEVWNQLLQDQAWDTLKLLVQMIRQPNVDQIMSRISEQNGSLTADDRDSLFEKLTWSTWNLVQGPQMDIRFDDPKSKPENFTLDAMDHFSAPAGAAYLAHTEALGQAMIAFNDQIKKENLKKVTDAAQLKRRQNGAIEEPGKIPRAMSPVREAKRFFPILAKPAENAIHAHAQLRGALEKYVDELRKVGEPVAYREEMWVSQGGSYGLSGAMPRRTAILCIICSKKYHEPEEAPARGSDRKKSSPMCKRCNTPREFVK